MKYKYIIGIDEAGRGPLAGPVSVGAVLFESGGYEKFKKETKDTLAGRDSKKLSEKKREEWFEKIKKLQLESAVAFSSNKVIDTKDEWSKLNSDDQSDYKAQIYGFSKSFTITYEFIKIAIVLNKLPKIDTKI